MARYVVTGASSGIGREIALQLASNGHGVIALGRNRARLEELALQNRRIEAHVLDLCDRGALMTWASELAKGAAIDGLINNAAIQHNVRFDDPGYGADAIVSEVETNLLAPMILSRLLLPKAPPHPFVIVNVGTALAGYPKATSAVYSATKAGLRMFSDALSAQHPAALVRVVDVVLPLVDTPMTAGRGQSKVSAAYAAREILRAMEPGKTRVHVGRARLLRLLEIIAPPAAAAIIRRL